MGGEEPKDWEHFPACVEMGIIVCPKEKTGLSRFLKIHRKAFRLITNLWT